MPTDLARSATLPPAPPAPERLVLPPPEFAADYAAMVQLGADRLRHSKVAFVGLARSCAAALYGNLVRLEKLAACCREWCLHIEENDSDDDTVQVLVDFAATHRQATFASRRLGRGNYSAEFGGRRTIALAEYRTDCQRWVHENAADADYVVVVDWDAWGGWWHDGVLAGFGSLVDRQGAYGMASVSLLETPMLVSDGAGEPKIEPRWAHYDAWAMRGLGQPEVTWCDYTRGEGGWKHGWLPPVGSEPAIVASAFGGMAIYRTHPYLVGRYDGTSDCEHVTYHASIREAGEGFLYVCPSMRTFMRWMDATR